LSEKIDELFAGTPQMAGVLRAMLLGDRSFVDREESADFQKTGVFHVLVVAGCTLEQSLSLRFGSTASSGFYHFGPH
jgi:Competence protein